VDNSVDNAVDNASSFATPQREFTIGENISRCVKFRRSSRPRTGGKKLAFK
jgi:hypothetical protein